MHILLLAGGPDRERPVSLRSGDAIEAGLRQAGHAVTRRDIQPDDFSALDQFRGEVVFPALHGAWGEGGPLQEELERRGLCYVGCGPAAARLCMDKAATKQALRRANLPTPDSLVLTAEDNLTFDPPLVLKPLDDGSSIDVAICRTPEQARTAWARLAPNRPRWLVERFIEGPELTVGLIDGEPLPPIRIVPATAFYDYDAKYDRHDTRYLFEPPRAYPGLWELARRVYEVVGCRHLARVDVMVDRATGGLFVLEVNTMPGFTDHSLLPKAAAEAGIGFPELVDRLVKLAAADR